MMKRTRGSVIVALGFFVLVAQTLLFRDFLAAFEGSELGIGSFFASWLLWVGIGAFLGRIEGPASAALTRRFELTVLLYLPAFLLQQFLIVHAREIGGVSAFEIYPFGRMFAVSFLVNAPVSFVTGLLFTIACRWASGEHGLPVARVYILETLGSCLGGIAVTLLLAQGVSAERVWLVAAWMLVASGGIIWWSGSREEKTHRTGAVLAGVLLCLTFLLVSGFANWWNSHNARVAWSRLLPSEEYRGSFTTSQGRYLYGEREGQFVVMAWGGVIESLPNTEHASEVIALSLSQQPRARNVLVVGAGSLGICLRLKTLPQIEEIVWLDPDPDYPTTLRQILPEKFREASEDVLIPRTEVRRFVDNHPRRFDLILLNLPDPTTLVLNRYWTREFFQSLKTSLAEDGVLCTRFSGAANFMGDELVCLGSSALHTLESVFPHVVLKPGDESWLIASDSETLNTAPAELRDRFAAVDGAASIYPPDGLLSLYVPDRIEFQTGRYRGAAIATGESLLINTDERPKALLFSLLLAVRRTEALSLARHLRVLMFGGVWIVTCPILIYSLLRFTYLWNSRGRLPKRGIPGNRAPKPETLFDGHFLIFSTGLAGMAFSIVLMFLYQSRFGSLFLHIGLISSLFMLGASLGGMLSERLLVSRERVSRGFLATCIVLHLLLVLVIWLVTGVASHLSFSLSFLGCGAFVGVYFPVVAHQMRSVGRTPATAGSTLEMLDHVGGAAGAVVAAWLLLPVLGSDLTLCVLALLVAVNLAPIAVSARIPTAVSHPDWFDRLTRSAAYVLTGVALCVLVASHVVAAVQSEQQEQALLNAARSLAGADELMSQQTFLDDGSTLTYWAVANSSGAPTYVFGTNELVHGVNGYGGPVVLAVWIEADGTLRDLRIVRSHETPSYVELLTDWLKSLSGHNLFHSSGLDDIDAVSGATMTSEAILQTLQQAGPRFAASALAMDVETASPSERRRPDHRFLCLAGLLGLAIVLRRFPGIWSRRGFLVLTLVLTGFLWNLQYSSQQVMALLSLNVPGDWTSSSFLLVLLVPVVVLLFGNVYCGYVCPFGALQELVGDLRPARLDTDPHKDVWRYGRAFKYVLLALLVVLFGLTRDDSVLVADPLITIFGAVRDWFALWMGILLIVTSVVFRRFWCRNLCPAGAFLSLLCGVKLLKRLRPRTGPARCDLGVRAADELDCLCCDRCRHAQD